jgi:hypothetical protein
MVQLKADVAAHKLLTNAVLAFFCFFFCCCWLQMVQLEAEVAAKQQLLQQLAEENASLTAKARVLDQLVASAGQ